MSSTLFTLEQVVEQMACGDSEALFTFVERFRDPISHRLRDASVHIDHVELGVHDVAIALFEAAHSGADRTDPWALLDRVVHDTAASLGAGPAGGKVGPVLDLHQLSAPVESSVPRTVHLIDVENLVGGSTSVRDWFAATLHELVAASPVGPDDHIVMAADVNLWRATVFGVTGCRYLAGYGMDGADDALLGALTADWIAERFGRLVIASGDHAFVSLASDAVARGVEVLVVTRPNRLSMELRLAATEVHYLPDQCLDVAGMS